VDTPEGVVGLAAERPHLLQLRRVVERGHPVARRLVGSAAVDGGGDAGHLERHRGVGHHRGAFGDAGEDGVTGSVEVVDDLDAGSVLRHCDDGRRERRLSGMAVKRSVAELVVMR
jgi:hypothetical protein